MLLTIVDTKSYGKFVLHLYPYQPLSPPKDDVTPIELTQSLTNAFQYFGMYQKSDVISTSTGSLKEGTVVDLFEANQKYTEVVMGIDQNCVLVSKSSFLDSPKQLFQNLEYPSHNIELGEFISLNDCQSSIVNSISLVYRQQTFDNVELIKHKLAFLVSALQTKEKHSKYLSKQIALIVEEKNQFKRILKQKCSFYLKQNNAVYEQFKIKMIYKEIQAQVQSVIKKIHVFELLQKIFSCWDKKQFFKAEPFQDFFMTSINCLNLKIPQVIESKEKIKLIENKTIVTIQLKLNSLPSVFSSHERIEYIYDRVLSNNSKPLKSLLSNQLDISPESVYHTVYFLMRNDLAVCVFPFDHEKYYSLYTLRSMPDKKVIQKYYSLFDGQNILEYLKKFQKYHRIKYLDEKVKYLLLNKIIKEVNIYIEKLEPVNERNHLKNIKTNINELNADKYRTSRDTIAHPSSGFINKKDVEFILNQLVTKPEEINVILSRCRQNNIKMSDLINFVKHNSNYWKFIFIQKIQ